MVYEAARDLPLADVPEVCHFPVALQRQGFVCLRGDRHGRRRSAKLRMVSLLVADAIAAIARRVLYWRGYTIAYRPQPNLARRYPNDRW